MARHAEPERELVRKAAPFGLPAIALAFVIGATAGGMDVGLSAAIGVAVVVANFVVSGLSVARAGRVSPQALFAVAAVGVPVRLGAIIALMVVLNRFAFFSPLAFGLAVVPATLLLLGFELKVWSGPMGRELTLDTKETIRR